VFKARLAVRRYRANEIRDAWHSLEASSRDPFSLSLSLSSSTYPPFRSLSLSPPHSTHGGGGSFFFPLLAPYPVRRLGGISNALGYARDARTHGAPRTLAPLRQALT